MALVFQDGPEVLLTVLAAMRMGAAAPLDPNATAAEFEALFEHLRSPTLLTGTEETPAVAAATKLGMRVLRMRFRKDYEPMANLHEARQDAPARTVDASLLLFTSATTGRPKLVPLTGANLECSCRNEAGVLGIGPADRVLGLTPLHNARGIRTALMQLSQGASVICAPSIDPVRLPQWLVDYQPTWISIASAGLSVLQALPAAARPASLRFLRIGGARPQAELVSAVEEQWGVPVLDGYGTTETGCITRSTPQARKRGSVGPSAGPEIAILDAEGRAAAPVVGGEIAVRGTNVTAGYIDDDEANRRAFRDGWFHTRDLGYLDADGFLFLTGRLEAIINTEVRFRQEVIMKFTVFRCWQSGD